MLKGLLHLLAHVLHWNYVQLVRKEDKLYLKCATCGEESFYTLSSLARRDLL